MAIKCKNIETRDAFKCFFYEYPPTEKKANQSQWATRTNPSNMIDKGKEPFEQQQYLYLLGMLKCIAHSFHDLLTSY